MLKNTNNLPDFRDFGYKVTENLGANHTGGRFTFKAIALKEDRTVVIKQFRFATKNSGWGGYKALEREIETLQKIDHPQIPKYLTNFDSGDGLCLVMEYVDGQPLSSQYFEAEEVKKIAIALLKILTYTHNLNIIHRDIKPENILIDKDGKIYLIDFGLASFTANNESMRASSVVAGTIGMMPPEQLLNKRVTQKSDIYSLGVTIFCLLMKQNTGWISSIIDSSFRIRAREYLDKKVDYSLIDWLEKCVEPELEKRFPSAEIALTELEEVNSERLKDYVDNLEHNQKSEQKRIEESIYLKSHEHLAELEREIKKIGSLTIKQKIKGVIDEVYKQGYGGQPFYQDGDVYKSILFSVNYKQSKELSYKDTVNSLFYLDKVKIWTKLIWAIRNYESIKVARDELIKLPSLKKVFLEIRRANLAPQIKLFTRGISLFCLQISIEYIKGEKRTVLERLEKVVQDNFSVFTIRGANLMMLSLAAFLFIEPAYFLITQLVNSSPELFSEKYLDYMMAVIIPKITGGITIVGFKHWLNKIF